MPTLFGKFKDLLKKAALLGGLFLAAFALGFYVVNLDLGPAQKISSQKATVQVPNLNEELKKRLGSIALGMENYDDWARRYGLDAGNNGLDADPDKEGLPNYLEYVYGTNPLKADSDGDGFSDKQEIINGYDPDAPGDAKPAVEISISKINVSAPMVWSQSETEKNMLSDLENGVSHFFHTASPGQNGNMIISGHSSNYIWAKGNYNHIFKDLNNLEPGDVVVVKTMQKNGRSVTYQYKISEKLIVSPDDEKIFAATAEPSLTLSTCWPLGTNFRRLIIKADLVK